MVFKKTVLKIFIILFEQDCPEALVHAIPNGLPIQSSAPKTRTKYGQFSLEIGHSGGSRLGHSIKDRHKSGYSATTQTTTKL